MFPIEKTRALEDHSAEKETEIDAVQLDGAGRKGRAGLRPISSHNFRERIVNPLAQGVDSCRLLLFGLDPTAFADAEEFLDFNRAFDIGIRSFEDQFLGQDSALRELEGDFSEVERPLSAELKVVVALPLVRRFEVGVLGVVNALR